MINEATDGKISAARLRPLIDQRLRKLDKKTLKIQGGSKQGWKNFWTKVKKIATKVGKAILPGLAEIGKKAAPAVVKQILSGIAVTDKNKPWLEMANSLADSAGSLIPSPGGSGLTAEYMNPPPRKPAKRGGGAMDPEAKAAFIARMQAGRQRAAARRASERAADSFVSGVPAPPSSTRGGKKAASVTMRF